MKTTTQSGQITKLVTRSSRVVNDLGIKSRQHFHHTVYFVKFPSGVEYPCDSRAQADALVNDEPAVLSLIAAMNDRLAGRVAS